MVVWVGRCWAFASVLCSSLLQYNATASVGDVVAENLLLLKETWSNYVTEVEDFSFGEIFSSGQWSTFQLEYATALWRLKFVSIVMIQSWRCQCWAGLWQLAAKPNLGVSTPAPGPPAPRAGTNFWQQDHSESPGGSEGPHLWRPCAGRGPWAVRIGDVWGNLATFEARVAVLSCAVPGLEQIWNNKHGATELKP